MPDKQIMCAECKQEFAFTEDESQRLHDLVKDGKIDEYHEPRRCRPCRNARKQQRKSQGA
jgi:hypothetical protein